MAEAAYLSLLTTTAIPSFARTDPNRCESPAGDYEDPVKLVPAEVGQKRNRKLGISETQTRMARSNPHRLQVHMCSHVVYTCPSHRFRTQIGLIVGEMG